jgi:hypothetical protein
MHSRRQVDKAYMLQQCWKHTTSYHRPSPSVLTGVTKKSNKQRWLRIDHQDMSSALFVTFDRMDSELEEAVSGTASISTTKWLKRQIRYNKGTSQAVRGLAVDNPTLHTSAHATNTDTDLAHRLPAGHPIEPWIDTLIQQQRAKPESHQLGPVPASLGLQHHPTPSTTRS